MTTFSTSPRLIKAGLVLLDPKSGNLQRIIVFQYNPDKVSRTLKVDEVEDQKSGRMKATHLKGPPGETIKLDIEIDATSQPDFLDRTSKVADVGIFPQLYALETVVYPESSQLKLKEKQSKSGKIEIAPTEGPVVLLVWSKNRIAPVKLTDMSITEEEFDPDLNPIRAKVNLSMKVLSVSDVGFDHRISNLYLTYHQKKEALAKDSQEGVFTDLGIKGI
jgi:hypothetical protein